MDGLLDKMLKKSLYFILKQMCGQQNLSSLFAVPKEHFYETLVAGLPGRN